ncbi:hypothetical protein [Leptospira sp. GIMC2001]|uniref:hypothetical protein n=1 Tax=Leptospira sp. GIMC2001 TaxID=1513297 RepID=UPI00234B990C|nr:hypothetical protein [Leptospira sp. GIMC2001]WCL49924.1 hypothetical protein O4O04_03650 [Leptospira sp. GIMC2001]
MSLNNLNHQGLPKSIKIGIWASYVSAFMLIGIGIFWLIFPMAAEGSFSISADTDSAIRFAKILAIFKSICDILPPIFVILAIQNGQFKLAGQFHLVTLVLVILVDMWIWANFVPNSSLLDIIQHIPFAIPIAIAAYAFLKNSKKEVL